jgi:nicotinate-nucleotide pyrophosphorylase (carboxylating)
MIAATVLDPIVEAALAEDLSGGDLTTEATVDVESRALARATAKSALVVCGGDVFARVMLRIDPGLRVEQCVPEGSLVDPGTVVWVVEGSTRSILMAERTALNFVQRLCGVATLTRRFLQALPPGSKTRIADTRKTTPGLRALERYAVRCGGAHNHRNDLGSAVLIKDNHIEAAGGVASAVMRARQRAPHTSMVEVEVESLEMLDEALSAGADIIMLDNFAPEAVMLACQRARGRALVEVSGGITLERVAALGALDVDVISVGALTHSAPSADISLDVERIV